MYYFNRLYIFFNRVEDGGKQEKTVVARVSLVVTFVHRDIFGMF